MATFAKASERRKASRNGASQAGEIIAASGAKPEPCQVSDLSTRGARLRFSRPISLPTTFDLRLAHGRHRTRARIAWRRGSTVGVEFDTPLEPVLLQEESQARRWRSAAKALAGVLVLAVIGILRLHSFGSGSDEDADILVDVSLRPSLEASAAPPP